MKITVAMAQAIPAVLNREAAVEKACAWILEAGRRGAAILAFPETWLPVYPFWCDAGTFSAWGHEGAKRLQFDGEYVLRHERPHAVAQIRDARAQIEVHMGSVPIRAASRRRG